MKTGFFFALLIASLSLQAALAAPLCSQVLHQSSLDVSEEAVTASIKQIAQLKIDLDRAQARGSQQGMSGHYLFTQYPKKYQELVQGLQGRLTEKEVTNLIKKEIRQLQKIKVSTRERDRQDKKVKEVIERTRPLSFEYDLVEESGNAPTGQVTSSEYIYSANENSIYHFDGVRLEKFDLKKGYDNTILNYTVSAGSLMNDGKSLLMLTEEGLRTFDIKTQRLSRPKKIALKAEMELPPEVRRLLLSPSESYVILKGYNSQKPWYSSKQIKAERGYRFAVVDLTTKKQILSQYDFPKGTTDIAFLNDQQIAVIRNSDLLVIDIASKKTLQTVKLQKLKSKENEATLALSNDGKILTIAHNNGFISLSAQSPSLVINERIISQPESYPHIIKARGYPHAIIVTDSNDNVRLVDMESLNFEFEFTASTQGGKEPYQVAVSPEGEQILVLYKKDDDRYVDTWKRIPNR